MRKTELAHIGRAAVGLHADKFFEIEWLALGREFLGLGFGGLFEREARGGQSQHAWTNCFFPSAVLRTIGPI